MRARKQTADFPMEVPACKLSVIGNLGENIGECVRRTDLCAVIELRTNGIESRWECDEGADKLIRILNAYSSGPMLVRVIGDAELGSPRIRHSDGQVLILIVGKGQIDRHWPGAVPVGHQPAPRLSGQELPFAAFYVREVQSQPMGMAVHALIDIRSVVAAEIAFNVGGDVVAAKTACDCRVQAGELRRGTPFGDTSLGHVVVGYSAEIGGDVALSVRRAKDILEIREAAETQNCFANLERRELRLFWFVLFLTLLRGRLLFDVCICSSICGCRRKRGRGRIARSFGPWSS